MESDLDKVLEEGDCVYNVYWDSGGPGGGADKKVL